MIFKNKISGCLAISMLFAVGQTIIMAGGEEIYTKSCAVCHQKGLAGAPKVGDNDAWSTRVGQGKETLYEHAIKGFQGSKGTMPPKGGNTSLSDDDVKAAVDYMVDSSK